MAKVIDTVKGRITDYDEKAGEVVIRAKYSDLPTMIRREYKEVSIQFVDSRPLSSKQRRNCYALIGEISDWMGEDKDEAKELLKVEFWTAELYQTADSLFSLSNAPMSIVAAFQKWLARFIVRNDIPTKKSLLSYVDDVADYVYTCACQKKCCICGRRAEVHHHARIGMGRNREEIDQLGMPIEPLCREHHMECHTMSQAEFDDKYHIEPVEVDRHLKKIWRFTGERKRHDQL